MTAAYFEDHPTDPNKIILRKRSCPYCSDTPRTWVGLTDEEIWTVLQFRGYSTDTIEVAKAIETKLKEKNT